jgi:hypothetical protein
VVFPGHPGSCFVGFVRMERHAGRWPQLQPGKARPRTGAPIRSPALPFPYSRYRYRLKIAGPSLDRTLRRISGFPVSHVEYGLEHAIRRPSLDRPRIAGSAHRNPGANRRLHPPQPGRESPAPPTATWRPSGGRNPSPVDRIARTTRTIRAKPHLESAAISYRQSPPGSLVSKRYHVPHLPTSRISPAEWPRSRCHPTNHLHSHKAGVPYQPGSESRPFAPDRFHVR